MRPACFSNLERVAGPSRPEADRRLGLWATAMAAVAREKGKRPAAKNKTMYRRTVWLRVPWVAPGLPRPASVACQGERCPVANCRRVRAGFDLRHVWWYNGLCSRLGVLNLTVRSRIQRVYVSL